MTLTQQMLSHRPPPSSWPCSPGGDGGRAGDLTSLPRPTVPSGAIQGRMRAKPEEPAASSAGTASGLRGPVRPVRMGFIPHEREK